MIIEGHRKPVLTYYVKLQAINYITTYFYLQPCISWVTVILVKEKFIINLFHMFCRNEKITSRLQEITRDQCFSDIYDSNVSVLLISQFHMHVTCHGYFFPSATHTHTQGISLIKIYHCNCLDLNILNYFHFLHYFFQQFYDIIS